MGVGSMQHAFYGETNVYGKYHLEGDRLITNIIVVHEVALLLNVDIPWKNVVCFC